MRSQLDFEDCVSWVSEQLIMTEDAAEVQTRHLAVRLGPSHSIPDLRAMLASIAGCLRDPEALCESL